MVDSIMSNAREHAPFGLLIAAVSTFFVVGFFSYGHYLEFFSANLSPGASIFMAISVSTLTEFIRLVLLVATFRDFSDSKPANGWLGLLASVGMVWWDVTHAQAIAEQWQNPFMGKLLVFFVVLGLVLELRIVLTGKATTLSRPKPTFSTNGHPSRRKEQPLNLGN